MVTPDISGALGTLRARFAPDISGALGTEKVNSLEK